MEKTTTMTGKGLQLTNLQNDSAITVRDFAIPSDVKLLATWITTEGSQVPNSFVDQISLEYTSYLSDSSFQLYILEMEGAPSIIAEVYLSSFAGMLPAEVSGKDDAILLKCYFNPMEDPGILQDAFAFLVELLHRHGVSGIWMDAELSALELETAKECGFIKSKQHQLLVHQA